MPTILSRPLRIGFVGAGFIAHFHLKALLGVRNVEVRGVYSPTPAKREALAAGCRHLRSPRLPGA
jgi:predicted dehydrogenase